MAEQTSRWQLSLANYQKALARLTDAIVLTKQRTLSELEQQGLIQAFEYTHELAWKTLKHFLQAQGVSDLYGSKDVTRKAYAVELISDGDTWMEMIKSRNLSSHTYHEAVADEVFKAATERYYPLFIALSQKLASLSDGT